MRILLSHCMAISWLCVGIGALAVRAAEPAATEPSSAQPPAGPAAAAPTATDLVSADGADLQDVFLLHAGRPVMVRLHIHVQGQGYQASWGDYLWEQFQELDLDGDGALDNDEFQRGDWQAIATRRTKEGAMRTETATFLDLDTDPQDDGVSFTEIVKHLAQSCFAVSRGGAPRPQQGTADPLFELLDGDQDRQLDAPEITAGLARLYRYDRDEDETFSPFELRSDGNPFLNNFNVRAGGGQAVNDLPLAPVPGQALDALAQAMMTHYDKASADASPVDKMLSREELRIPEEQFAVADSDGDGRIDAAELEVWLTTRRPDLEVAVNLDRSTPAEQRLHILGAPEDKQLEVVPAKDGSLVVRGKSFELELKAMAKADDSQREMASKQIFKRADQDNNDYLDRQEMRQAGRNYDFALVDKDRDGKVFLPEYLAYVNRQNEMSGRRVDLAMADRGSTLFEILDANHDNQLATRELRTLAGMVANWDSDSDGRIKSDDIPRRYQFQLAPGGILGGRGDGVFTASLNPAGGRNPQQLSGIGPEWFQRMDRNRDGDLSRREFLGSRAAFERLDADHDGLLDAKEAAALTEAK